MQKKTIILGAGVVFKKGRGTTKWFLVKQGDSWEIPKSAARRGESSVRAVIRAMAEQGGMNAKVLEEVGRKNAMTRGNGQIISQKIYYYLASARDIGEILGYEDAAWLEFAKATRKITNKKEVQFLRKAKHLLTRLEKEGRAL